MFFFFNDTATTEIYTLSLHDALPILGAERPRDGAGGLVGVDVVGVAVAVGGDGGDDRDVVAGDVADDVHVDALDAPRSEEHTSELQSRQYLVCRLLLEKKKKQLHCST